MTYCRMIMDVGPCRQLTVVRGDRHCYYHTKLVAGVTTPERPEQYQSAPWLKAAA